MEAAGEGFRAPLFRAVLRGDLALSVLGHPDQTPPLSKLDRTRLPAIALVVDDCDTTRFGPDGWRHAAHVMRWARAVMLHGTGGTPQHYEWAASAVRTARRVAVIETTSAHLDEWMALTLRFVRPEQVLRLQPFPGNAHPAPIPHGALQ